LGKGKGGSKGKVVGGGTYISGFGFLGFQVFKLGRGFRCGWKGPYLFKFQEGLI